MTSKDLAALALVTDLAFSAAEARMSRLRQEAERLSAQLAVLRREEAARVAARNVADLAVRAGADLRWEQWIAQRREQLNAALARLHAQIERERPLLRAAYGRTTATADLIRQAKLQSRDAARRRAEREG